MDLSKLLTRTQIAKQLGLSTVQAAKLIDKAGIKPQVIMLRGTKQTTEYYAPKDAERLLREQQQRQADRQARAAAFAAKASRVLDTPEPAAEQKDERIEHITRMLDAVLAVNNGQSAALEDLKAQVRGLGEQVQVLLDAMTTPPQPPARTELDTALDELMTKED